MFSKPSQRAYHCNTKALAPLTMCAIIPMVIAAPMAHLHFVVVMALSLFNVSLFRVQDALEWQQEKQATKHLLAVK